jgi:hypothetical protein
MIEVILEEIQGVLHNFQNDKISGPDGFPVEFYTRCFEFLGLDLLRVVKYSRIFGCSLVAFNISLIVLILKSENSSTFE